MIFIMFPLKHRVLNHIADIALLNTSSAILQRTSLLSDYYVFIASLCGFVTYLFALLITSLECAVRFTS